MSELLMRDAAPLSEEEWALLDNVVVKSASQFLVGRQFIKLVGPLGAGAEMIPVGSGSERKFLALQVIQEDFQLSWRDIESSRNAGYPLELGPAAKAAMICAQKEDALVVKTLEEAAKSSVVLGNWDEGEIPLTNVVQATESLVNNNCFGPYAVIVSPALYTKTQRIVPGAGMLVSKLIKGVAAGGLFQSPLLKADQGFVVALGEFNLDIALGQDLITAYTGNDGLDHTFRVLESVVVRVKRPGAICKLSK